ncbi:MAG: hypothetical protein IPM29_09085 [Planctomycetes bacterium]|nr:hypothetical protein [Planctomycetota bacterium]
MTSDPSVDGWERDVLGGEGRIPFARVVEVLIDVGELRELAKRYGAVPKGYRPERAPLARLLKELVDTSRPPLIRELCERVVSALRAEGEKRASDDGGDTAETVDREVLARREQEVATLRAELERARAQGARQREREARLVQDLDEEKTRVARLRAEADELRRRAEAQKRPRPRPLETDGRVRELERELTACREAEDGLRRLVAVRQARIRELDEQVAELRELVPASKRRAIEPVKAPALADAFRLPRFTPSFYKSLEGKERRSVEKALQAALLFCTEGPGYPGLEVKQIEGQELWSLRASLKLRVYFHLRDDGDVDFVALADREDQHTTLRRLKER